MLRLLLVTTQLWPFAARLAIAFARSGCVVEAVCPRGHVLEETAEVQRLHRYRLLGTLGALAASIRAAAPDFILPCDDTAAMRLCQLSRHAAGRAEDQALAALIEKSMGRSASVALATQRGELMGIAQREGIRIPETGALHGLADLEDWLSRGGLPTVIKGNGTFGGVGVAVVRTADEARAAFSAIHAVPSRIRALKRLIVNREALLLEQRRDRDSGGTIVQAFVGNSQPANRAVACWQGEVLAGISVIAVETAGGGGPASMVEVIDHPEMADAATKIVRRLGLSGFCGLDFMVSDDRQAAYLIEINPRATPIAHLALGPGRNLPAALAGRLAGVPANDAVSATESRHIGLFPNAWLSNPNNPRLQTCYHDVPWENPALLQACLKLPWGARQSAWGRLKAGWWQPAPQIPPRHGGGAAR